MAYFVGFMVVLGVEFEDLSLLSVIESASEVVCSELFPPLLTFNEPIDRGMSVMDTILIHVRAGKQTK